MLNPLLAYQAIICNFSHKFRPSDWLNYDLAFRRHASINHVLQWDSYDEDAYDSFLRDRGISSCYGCGKPGHFLNNCPAKSTGGSSSSTSSIGKPAPNGMPTTSGGSSPITTLVTRPVSGNFRPNPDTQPKPCIRYNKTGYCENTICFTLGAHFCNKPNCGGLTQGWPALDNSTVENSEVSIELHSLLPAHCSTPVNISEPEKELASHPDRAFVNSLLHDLTYGFDIAYLALLKTYYQFVITLK